MENAAHYNTTNEREVRGGKLLDMTLVKHPGLIIQMFRSDRYTGTSWGFLPACIISNKGTMWQYSKSLGYMVDLYFDDEGEAFIIAKNHRKITNAFRVSDLTRTASAKVGGKVVRLGICSVEDLLDIKLAAAEEEDIEVLLSNEEQEIIRRREEAELQQRNTPEALAKAAATKAAEVAAEAAEQQAKEAARREKQLRIDAILKRSLVYAWDRNGKHFFGIPVTSDAEWKCLPGDKYCIMMHNGQPVEAFITEKKNSKVGKLRPTEVFAQMPSPNSVIAEITSDDIPEALEMRNVTIGNERREIFVFGNMEDIRTLKRTGLDSGTWVGVLGKSKELTVYSVNEEGIKTLGIAKAALAMAA